MTILIIIIGDAEELFERSLKNGFLNITVVSIAFVGMESLLVCNAKRRVFQEPPTTSGTFQPIDHNVYFRAKGNLTLQKIRPDNYNDIICYAMSSEEVDSLQNNSTLATSEPDIQVTSESKQASEGSGYQDPIRQAIVPHVTEQYLDSEKQNLSHLPNIVESSEQHTDHTVTKSVFSLESIPFESFIKYMGQLNTAGKIELYHVFNYGHDFCTSEIFRVFMKNVSLCVLVTDESKGIIRKEELNILQENQTFVSKGLVIGSVISDENVSLHTSQNAELHQFASFLFSCQRSQDYIHSINCNEVKEEDNDTVANIIDCALSSSASNQFPLSWYFFWLQASGNHDI